MADSTGKVLKELSDLTKNIDVLVKEMKEAKTLQDKSTESVKNLSKTLEQNEKKKEGTEKTQESLFQNFIESFKKFNEEKDSKFFDDLNKSLSLNLEKIVSNLPNQIAQTKKAETSPLEDTFSKLVKKTTDVVPGLAKGGDVTKSGMAVVGEKGPELVDLNKGDKVLTTRQAELMAKRQEVLTKSGLDFEKSQKEREDRIAKETVEQNLSNLSGSTGKDDVINDSGGIKGPTESEILKYRNSILQDDAQYYKDFPDELEYDVKQWIENYEKKPFKGFENKLENLDTPPSKNPVENLNTETTKESVESKLLSENKKDKKKGRKEKLEENEGKKIQSLEKLEEKEGKKIQSLEKLQQPEKESVFSKMKSGAGKISSDFKESFSEQKTSFSTALNTDINNLKSSFGIKQNKPSEMSSEKVKGQTDKLSSVQPKIEQKMPPAMQETTVKPVAPVEQKSSDQTDIKPVTTDSTANKKSNTETSNMEKNQPLNSKDVGEIKGLLSAIYKTLNGPLNISSDVPFRPFSNQL